MPSTILLTVPKSNVSAGRRITNPHPSYAIRQTVNKTVDGNDSLKVTSHGKSGTRELAGAVPYTPAMKEKMTFVESSYIAERFTSHKRVPALAIFPFSKTVVDAFVIKSESIEVWFATHTCFGVTKQHYFVTNTVCFVANTVCFVTNKVCFVTKQSLLPDKQSLLRHKQSLLL